MESSKAGNAPASFMQQMLHNNMLLLAVSLAVGGVIYLVAGIYMLVGR